MEGMTRLQRELRTVACCVAAVLMPIAIGGLLGGLAAALLPPTEAQRISLASEGSVIELSEAYNSSGQELFSRFTAASGDSRNIVFSPSSIGTALALALSGARGETEAEMIRALRHSLTRMEVDSANSKVLAILNEHSRGSSPFSKSSPTKLAVANAVMLAQQGGAISPGYLATAKANYAAEVFRNADIAAVNNWVSRKTEGKIDRILDKLDPKTAAVLLNAIYFKAPWRDRFDSKLTSAAPFAISTSQSVQVQMMHRDGLYSAVTEPGFSAIRIPYAATQLSMVIVRPDRIDGLPDVIGRLDSVALRILLARLRRPAHRVYLGLPRFKTEFAVTLNDHLRALGMVQAFDGGKADFSGMTGGSAAIHIKDVMHKAVIEVAEEGTEAAAATAVHILTSGPPPFRVDRPFAFYIVEGTTNTILFQGRIVDPR
jgi:serpin B